MNKPNGSQSFRSKKHRLPNEMYQLPGAYFITICTHQKKHLLAKFDHFVLEHSHLGILAEQRLQSLPEHHPSLELGQFVIMPNHLHAIFLLISDSEKHESIINVVNQFKASVTRLARKQNILGKSPLWQSGFWDHIVRDEEDHLRIQEYIVNNPLAWHLDIENPKRDDKHPIYEYLANLHGTPIKKRYIPK